MEFTSIVILIVAIVGVFEFFHIGYLVNKMAKISLATLEAVDKRQEGQRRCASCYRAGTPKDGWCPYCRSAFLEQ